VRPGLEDLAKTMHPSFGASFPDQGWDKIIIDCHNKLKSIDPDYVIYQVKEKFGTLRYYFYSNHSDRDSMAKCVEEAEELSAVTCELCGDPGSLDREAYWVKTLCPECTTTRKVRRDAPTAPVNFNEETAQRN
jgi:hypothetical protein